VRVDEVLDRQLGATVAVADEVVTVDGQHIDAWLAAHPYESNSLNDDVARSERANAIVTARLPWSLVKDGDVRTLRLRKGTEERDIKLTFSRSDRWRENDEVSFDDAPPMKSIGCRSDKDAFYNYSELAAVGSNVCVYRPTTNVHLDWEPPRTFETRHTWVDASVKEAVGRLEALRSRSSDGTRGARGL
jgi:hypothetical protein